MNPYGRRTGVQQPKSAYRLRHARGRTIQRADVRRGASDIHIRMPLVAGAGMSDRAGTRRSDQLGVIPKGICTANGLARSLPVLVPACELIIRNIDRN